MLGEQNSSGMGFFEEGGAHSLPLNRERGTDLLQKTILVVDDDEGIRRSLSIRLKSFGYDVALAEDGTSAYQAVVNDGPDLVLLDIGLPKGDGISVLERLTDNPKTYSTPVIVVSGNRLPTVRARAFDLGARAFIEKPFHPDELLRKIEDQFDLMG